MMLVHKPQNIILSSPVAYTHRRHPSAPVVVQPTRTPGLLTLSKPAKQSPHRQLASQQRREAKPVIKVSKHASGVVRAQVPTPSVEVKSQQAQVAPATPTPRPRAHHATPAKEIHRSASHSSLRGKHGRQPSPPIASQMQHQIPSQAEATTVPPIKSINLFDPFLDSPPPSPSLSTRPSGRLARRRQQDTPPASPTLSRAIPVPTTQRTSSSNLSRSDPVQSNMRPRPAPKRSFTNDFPICDDLAEAAAKKYVLSPPSTPTRSAKANGPPTAPPSANAPYEFPFYVHNIPARNPKQQHRRIPSEALFNMSSDEDVSTGPGGAILSSNVQALFATVANKRASLPANSSFATPQITRIHFSEINASTIEFESLSRERQMEIIAQAEEERAGFFASSTFQNSPSPEELPDPLLL